MFYEVELGERIGEKMAKIKHSIPPFKCGYSDFLWVFFPTASTTTDYKWHTEKAKFRGEISTLLGCAESGVKRVQSFTPAPTL